MVCLSRNASRLLSLHCHLVGRYVVLLEKIEYAVSLLLSILRPFTDDSWHGVLLKPFASDASTAVARETSTCAALRTALLQKVEGHVDAVALVSYVEEPCFGYTAGGSGIMGGAFSSAKCPKYRGA